MINTRPETANDVTPLTELQQQLACHPIYEAIQNTQDLKIFMQQHVFAVWDFMSLIKSAQQQIAPTTIPWLPSKHPQYVHFINQLVTEEESDSSYSDNSHKYPCSHFERYLDSMIEIGADTSVITTFIDTIRDNDIESALLSPKINQATKEFIKFTFDVIKRNQPHLTVAVLALGREALVPQLFRSLQINSSIFNNDAPQFFHYLQRHIQIDEQQHGPIAIKLLNELCANSSKKYSEAMDIAQQALTVRLEFWDAIHELLTPNQKAQFFL